MGSGAEVKPVFLVFYGNAEHYFLSIKIRIEISLTFSRKALILLLSKKISIYILYYNELRTFKHEFQ
jgi:hypothetical protein